MKSSNPSLLNPRKTPKKTPRKPKLKDPVEVYCRIRPLNINDEESCVEVINGNTIQLSPPHTSQGFKSGNRVTATQHTFKQVFDEDMSQKTIFNTAALPLVHDLIHGKNGLIFAYGITGSGKTYTMTGEPTDGGVLPRSLDVLFDSIDEFQTKPCVLAGADWKTMQSLTVYDEFMWFYEMHQIIRWPYENDSENSTVEVYEVFIPDKCNGMDVQSEYDAKYEHERKQKEMAAILCSVKGRPTFRGLAPLSRANDDDELNVIMRVPGSSIVDNVDEDSGYAVFVSYVEIYNNFIYDLLEDTPQDIICHRPPISKILREDNSRNMYVQGVAEVEVKSTEEAYAMFWKGQKKRRVANTQLNMQSSRSHSVFTLKLVQGPLDPGGESVLLDKAKVSVSILSICDLAGSERTKRTQSAGERLREAGNINKDLMTLRLCLEVLRDNQANADNGQLAKMVPYRDSRLTHLFKNFFDGEGKVRMVVCLNPSAMEYDESVLVMRFAEITQEVVVARPTGISSNAGLAPGRRKANEIYKEALKNIDEDDADGLEKAQQLKPLSTFPPFPLMELNSASDTITFRNLRNYLQERQTRRETLQREAERRATKVREMIIKVYKLMEDKDLIINEKDKEIQKLERRLKAASQKNGILAKSNQNHEVNVRGLQSELDEQLRKIDHEKQDKVKLKQALKGVSQEKDRWQKECDKRVKNKEIEMESKIFQREDKLRQLKEIVYKEKKTQKNGRGKGFFRSRSPPPVSKKPAVKLRHRRSRSTDCWLEHKPAENYETETILRPVLKKKKTVQIPQEKHFKASQATNYVLEHQEADSQGELETKFIKGDVYSTTSGGHCVQFTDIETLKTNFELARSPESNKRVYPEGDGDDVEDLQDDEITSSWTDVETRCAVALEGRPSQINPSICHNVKRRKPQE